MLAARLRRALGAGGGALEVERGGPRAMGAWCMRPDVGVPTAQLGTIPGRARKYQVARASQMTRDGPAKLS